MLDKDFLKWIKPHFFRILVCQKNLGFPVYKLKAGHHKRIRIDILAQNKKGTWIAIEFEDGDTFGNITKGIAQLEDFYRMIQNKEVKIYDNLNLEIKPDYFLLATQYCEKGYLYKNDKRIMQTSGYSKERKLKEYNHTAFCLTRMMWRFCVRNPYSPTNPVGVSRFGIIQRNYYGNPYIEINGECKYVLEDLERREEDDTKTTNES